MGGRNRIGVGGPAEGASRTWGRVPRGTGSEPRCVVKVDWPKPRDGGLRLDLEAVGFAEYIVGSQPNRPDGTGRGLPEHAKGQDVTPVAMFACHTADEDDRKLTTEFYKKWMRGDESLAGQDRTKWSMEQAWCVNLLRRPMQAAPGRYRRSPLEQRQYRIRLCPDPIAGQPIAAERRLEEFSRRFMAAIEADFGGRFVWIAGCHYNVDHPHTHIGMRGISQAGEHVFFPQSYLRPTALELKRKADASSPIEWRARGVLAEMMTEMGGKRAAG